MDEQKSDRLDVVLLVGSGDSAREALAHSLTARGMSVRVAEDARSARRSIAQHRPDLVVMELRLKDGPALPLLRWIKQTCQSIKVVVYTHYSSVATTLICRRMGAEGYLPKPASDEAVLTAASGHSLEASGLLERSMTLDRAVWEYLNRVVVEAGSISRAAERLGLGRRSLSRMLSKYAPK